MNLCSYEASRFNHFTVKSIFMAGIFKCSWYLWKEADPEFPLCLFNSQYGAKIIICLQICCFQEGFFYHFFTASPVRENQMEETLQKCSEGRRVKWVSVGCSEPIQDSGRFPVPSEIPLNITVFLLSQEKSTHPLWPSRQRQVRFFSSSNFATNNYFFSPP